MKSLLHSLGRSVPALVLAGTLDAADLSIPMEGLPQDTAADKMLAVKMDSGDFEGALKSAQEVVRKSPDTLGAWFLIGATAAQNGEFDQAIGALEHGLKNKETDVPFLLMIARIHEDRAELGPGASRIGGMVRYQPQAMKADPEKFRTDHLRLAADCFRRVIELRPTVALYQAKRASLLLAAGDSETAERETQAHLKDSPDNALLLLQLAKASVKTEHWEAARTSAEHCIALAPAEPEACEVLSAVAVHDGRETEAREWTGKTHFYNYMPRFLTVAYSEAHVRVVEEVTRSNQPDHETKEAIEARNKKARLAIDGLIAEKSNESSRLLAAIAWHHEWHGEVEEGIYRELENRRDEAIIMAVFDHAQSYCTVGGCAPALARLKSETAFPLILERLPSDRNAFAMGLPEALALYHRPEAVPVLGRTVQDIIDEKKGAGAPGDFMAFIGGRMLASRCLWALSCFDGAEARRYLETAAQKKEWSAEATAALFVQSKDPRHFKALMKVLKRDPAEARSIAERFNGLGLPEAVAVQALVPPEKRKKT